jgi:hypothetical protein
MTSRRILTHGERDMINPDREIQKRIRLACKYKNLANITSSSQVDIHSLN